MPRIEYAQPFVTGNEISELLVSSGPSDDYLELALPLAWPGITVTVRQLESLSGSVDPCPLDVRVAIGDPTIVSVLALNRDSARRAHPFDVRVREILSTLVDAAPALGLEALSADSALSAEGPTRHRSEQEVTALEPTWSGASPRLACPTRYLALRSRVHIALHTVEDVLRQDPANAKAWQLREDLTLLERRERQRHREPANAQAQLEVGFSYLTLGCDDDAVRALTQAVTLQANLYLAHVILGIAHHHKHQVEQARVCYERAARLRPEDRTPPDLLSRLARGDPPPIPIEDRPGTQEQLHRPTTPLSVGVAG